MSYLDKTYTEKEIAIVILAAGAGTRMGKIKQLLPGCKHTFLEEAIEKVLKLHSSRVFVVLGAHCETIEPSITHLPIKIIYHKDWQKGLGSTIAYGTKHIMEFAKEVSAILFVLADQPLVDEKYYHTLLNKYLKSNKRIVCSNYNNKPGVPAIFAHKYFQDLTELKGDVGAKRIMMENKQDLELLEEKPDLLDIDSPEDYLNYLKSIC